MLYDVFFDDFYTEMIIEENIERSLNTVNKSLKSVEDASNYLHKVLDNIEKDYKNAKLIHQDQKSKIFNLKKKLIHDEMNKQKDSTSNLTNFFEEFKNEENDNLIYTPSDKF